MDLSLAAEHGALLVRALRVARARRALVLQIVRRWLRAGTHAHYYLQRVVRWWCRVTPAISRRRMNEACAAAHAFCARRRGGRGGS